MRPGDRQTAMAIPRVKSKAKNRKSNPVDVLAAFNTWSFKREQPSDLPRLTDLVRDLVVAGRPIEFVLYWGKGPRAEPTAPETACLDYLAAMGRRIAAVHPPGATFRLICTDTHALLNGHARAGTMAYFCAVGRAAKDRGFKWCLLGDLTRAQSGNISHACPSMRPELTIAQLERSAARWYKGTGRPVDGAIAYYDMNMAEKRAVELEFPDAVFITFSGSELRDLFPDRLPIFYMYSVRKGVSVKPWFIDDTAAAAE